MATRTAGRAGEHGAGRLPTPSTTLVGRQRDVARVRELLRASEVRLLTLTGAGGTGKTRLALAAAAELRDAFADGVWFVDLAPVGDASLVGARIAGALQVPEAGGRSVGDLLVQWLRGRSLLLVLDNFEHVLEAELLISELLMGCPALKLLVTSRAALRLSGEHELAVLPLALPDSKHLPDVEELLHVDSVALFDQRARAARSDFRITPTNANAVAEICIRLDGLPLALELAAVRIKVLSPAALLARLGSRLGLLTDGPRDLATRQRTLRNTIEWSYNLLTPPERLLFTRLAVFAGGCTLKAAQAVQDGTWTEAELLDGLASLVDKSLVREWEDLDGEPRFGMLQTIREYASDRLTGGGEAASIKRRHTEYFATLAERAEPELIGGEQGVWMSQLELEVDNLRAAFQNAWTSGEVESVVRMAGALWRFWWARGSPSEGYRWLEDALVACERSPSISAVSRERLVNAAGALAYLLGDHERGVALYEEALALQRAAGDIAGVAASLNNLGMVAHYRGEYARAAGMYEEALTMTRDGAHQRHLAVALNNLGLTRKEQGHFDEAQSLLDEAVALFREVEDTRSVADALNNLSGLACARGDYARATRLGSEALETFQRLGDKPGQAESLQRLSLAAYAQRELDTADDLMQQALALAEEMSDKWGLGLGLAARGRIATQRGDVARATELLRQAIALYNQVADTPGLVGCIEALADVAARRGQFPRATRLSAAATALREHLGWPRTSAERQAQVGVQDLTRAHLAPLAFDTAWREGTRLDLADAITLALAEDTSAASAPDAAESTPGHAAAPEARTHPLSPREREVARLITLGFSNRQIAEALVITEGTAGLHVVHILNKLGFNKRAQIAAWAVEKGLATAQPA